MDHTAILVRDHEGNFSPGIWDEKFHPFFPIPFGFKKNWTYIKVVVKKMKGYDIIDADTIYLDNDNSLHITELYDFEDPVKINKPTSPYEP